MATDPAPGDSSIEIVNPFADQPRRMDIEAKQLRLAELIHQRSVEGVLILHPANFRWLTSGAEPAGLFGRDELPGLYFNSHQRWLLCSSLDSPRLFRECLDGLGFQIKEWHWSTPREQMLSDLVQNRRVIADQVYRECQPAGLFFAAERRRMSGYETDMLRDLGRVITHALEATLRNFSWGDPEEELAAHLAHRLVRHGVEPMGIQVLADGRHLDLARRNYDSRPVESQCNLQVTGRQHGLHVTASRTVFRSAPNELEKAEFDAAIRLRLAHLAASRADQTVQAAMAAGKALLQPSAFANEWWTASAACLTGREPSEGIFLPAAEDRWAAGWAVVWKERIGAASVVDTFVWQGEDWLPLTPPLEWPIRRGVVSGRRYDVADLLIRPE